MLKKKNMYDKITKVHYLQLRRIVNIIVDFCQVPNLYERFIVEFLDFGAFREVTIVGIICFNAVILHTVKASQITISSAFCSPCCPG